MPLGFQNRFTYGDPIFRKGKSGALSGSETATPLIGYEAVYSYRSGKRAKELSQAGAYEARVQKGSLLNRLQARTQYLNEQIKEAVEPTTGSTSAFSCTGDTGHPFASYKVRTFGNRLHYSYSNGVDFLESDLCLSHFVPWPDISLPFGDAYRDGLPTERFTYFSWPSVGNYISNAAPGLSRQVVSTVLKNNIAAGVIASANPWKPKASLAQTVLELLSGDIPTVTKNLRKYVYQLQDLKKAGAKDWLNLQFGWVPLANDIRATVEVLLKLHLLLYADEQSDTFRRSRGGDIGNWGRVVPTAYSTAVAFGSPLSPTSSGSPYLVNKKGVIPPSAAPALPAFLSWSRSTSISADFRFTAKYHRGARPDGRERGFLERATQLLGLEVTPAVLWELTPWTWLLDWGSNLGSVASNLSMLDWSNVLLDYAYLTTVVKTTSSVSVKLPSSRLTSTARLNGTYFATGYESIEKIREQANPYGFSVSWNGLSPFQLSILAALGMSRSR
jgi:hypothetical protein